ncbi:MAG TPA: MFS transporter, partial [Rhodocyclaceae bacterium]|nr:MFS transporter [Rhodocyclaceae bacterium]
PDIWWSIAGRIVQGAGAISAAVTALAADLTREQHRTKVMAMIGSSIGVVFALSLVAAPVLYAAIGMAGIFWMTAGLAIAAIGLVTHVVPAPPPPHPGPKVPFREVLFDVELLRLNFGIFTLHMIQMAMFVVVPGLLVAVGDLPVNAHWKIYLPVVLASFVLMVPAIVIAERRHKLKAVFLVAVALLFGTEALFWGGRQSFPALVTALLLFFVAFNILEASLPSMISRVAPPRAKGAALGVYNTTQAFGLFLGGALGGFLGRNFGPVAVFAFATGMAGLWLLVASGMKPPPIIATRELMIRAGLEPEELRRGLAALPGVREVTVVPERGMAYLRVNLELWDERRARQLTGGEA